MTRRPRSTVAASEVRDEPVGMQKLIDEAQPMLDETLALLRATRRLLHAMRAAQHELMPTAGEVERLEDLERVLRERRRWGGP